MDFCQSTPTAAPVATVEFNSPSFSCLKVMCYVWTYHLACLSTAPHERGTMRGNSSHLERDGSHAWGVLPTGTTLTPPTTARAFLTLCEPDVQTTETRWDKMRWDEIFLSKTFTQVGFYGPKLFACNFSTCLRCIWNFFPGKQKKDMFLESWEFKQDNGLERPEEYNTRQSRNKNSWIVNV